jgi:nucleoside-diphosphate-sugar epimerase
MKVILFGATGMVGQGVLRECLLDPGVESVLAVGRSPTGQKQEKLRELVHDNFVDFSAIEPQLKAYDACFFCLGVSSIGMDESATAMRPTTSPWPRRRRCRGSPLA